MKRILSFIAIVSLMFVGCRWYAPVERQPNVIPCNVDPDEVLGSHYTAADFQIWSMADDEMARVVSSRAVMEKGISSEMSGWRVSFADADTAEVGAIARELCASHRNGDTMCCYGWTPGIDSGKSTIVIVCGTKPLIDGYTVADAFVEKMWEAPAVMFEFAKEHHSDWQRITRDNIGRYLPIMLGNRMLAAPMVNAEIAGGKCNLTGLSEEECCALAAILTRGLSHK